MQSPGPQCRGRRAEREADGSAGGAATGLGKAGTDAAGYVLGGGAGHKLNPSWPVKVEYQHLNLGQDGMFANRAKEDYAVSTVRSGLNYHFGGGCEPLKRT